MLKGIVYDPLVRGTKTGTIRCVALIVSNRIPGEYSSPVRPRFKTTLEWPWMAEKTSRRRICETRPDHTTKSLENLNRDIPDCSVLMIYNWFNRISIRVQRFGDVENGKNFGDANERNCISEFSTC